MELAWPWVLVAAVVATIAAVAVALWWGPRRGAAGAVLVSQAERLRGLPRFAALAGRERLTAAIALVGVVLVVGGAAVVAARPITVERVQDETRNRDVILCLDASGSMAPYNVEVIGQFRQIVSGLQGERIGLTIFSGAAVTVFPLTDDYSFVLEQLDEAKIAFAAEDYDYIAGVQLNDDRASLMSDGLVSCVQRFDRPDSERGRAVVLASDNDPQGEPVYTLAEAGEYARDHGVVVYGIGTPGLPDADAEAEFADAVETSGGRLEVLGRDGSAESIVAGIDRLERTRLEGTPPRLIRHDRPVVPALVALVGLGGLVGAAGRRSLRAWVLPVLILAALITVLFQPGYGRARAPTLASDLEVLVVVDKTVSMTALDYDGDRPRLDGVRADLAELSDALPGARFALVSFGRVVRTELPFTTDPVAFGTAVDTLRPENPFAGSGSRIDAPVTTLSEILTRAVEQHPERRRVLVFISDGENTSGHDQGSFAELATLVDDGLVLGYGTTEGGVMPYDLEDPDSLIWDSETGEDARSIIDEDNLRAIAQQTGTQYQHQEQPGGLTEWAESLDQRLGPGGEDRPGPAHPLSWAFGLFAGLCGLVELGRAVARFSASRRVSRILRGGGG